MLFGDDAGAKNIAAGLIRDVGFNPVDMGSLSTTRYVDPFSLLAAQLAYNSSDGPAKPITSSVFPNHAR